MLETTSLNMSAHQLYTGNDQFEYVLTNQLYTRDDQSEYVSAHQLPARDDQSKYVSIHQLPARDDQSKYVSAHQLSSLKSLSFSFPARKCLEFTASEAKYLPIQH